MTDKVVNKICRICLRQKPDIIELFCEQEESKNILNTMYMCFQVKIEPEKGLPSVICKSCVEELNSAYNFRIMCVTIKERYTALREFILDKKLKIKEESKFLNIQGTTGDNLDFLNEIPFESDDLILEDTNNFEHNQCSICKKILKSTSSLSKHHFTMHENRKHIGEVTGFGSQRRYHCTTCDYSTPHSQTLTNHMRRHNGERPYSCECGKSFTQSSSLAAHRKTHSSTTYFTCSVCGKQFKHAFTLKKHLSVHENGQFNCVICHKTLKSKQSLQAHMQRHYNICNYNCEDCGDTFVTSAELLNHRKKHGGVKKIECHLCGYKTHSKKNLIIHLKRHIGNKDQKCNICHVSFYTRSDLRRHRRVHTREKPFSCPTCSQKFTHSPSLNKHMKTVHGIVFKWADVKWKQNMKMKLAVKKDGMYIKG